MLLAAAAMLPGAAVWGSSDGPAGSAAGAWVSAHVITAADTLFTGQYIRGSISDLMLENERIAVVISGVRHESPYSLSGGNIIDAGSRAERIDGLMEVYSHLNDAWPRQAIYSTIEIVDDGSTGGPAVVRVSGLDSKDPYLGVVTEYSLEAGADYVTISTTVVNDGSTTYNSFEIGDVWTWGDCDKYAPGSGFALWGDVTSAWLAGTNEQISYGYAAPGGADVWGEHGDLWSHMNVVAEDLAPGDSISCERYFIVGGRDIASVASIIHSITGVPTGSVSCSVTDADLGSPIHLAEIDVYDASDDPYLQMQTGPEGDSFTTLPAGTWHLVAGADGYEETDEWFSIGVDQHLEFDLALNEHKVVIPGIGDTLTVIQRPLLNIPAIVRPGDDLEIECDAHPTTTGWTAEIFRGGMSVPLEISSSSYDASTLWWTLTAEVPEVPLEGLYDLTVSAAGGLVDTTRHAVKVIHEFKDDYYFIQVTDTHLPTHRFYYESGAETDTSEMLDFRAVIDDINIINPEFVLHTGDLVNEGELEDFLDRRYYSKSQRMLTEFEVPVYLIAGNHDIGGWTSTPPPAGTARRDWWRFYGWKRLDSPPSGAPYYTQNYSFDYGPVHYVALEAYDNYDRWRYNIYGNDSFTARQMQWLSQDLAAASGSAAQVLFYHYDFSRQINLNALGVELALWGHIHSDAGSLSGPPYNLATNNVCDGERSYRLVRVSGGTVLPSPTLSAGSDGRRLDVDFEPANNGRNDSLTAYITNNQPERFEHAMLKFLMPSGCDSVRVTGGTLVAREELESMTRYYVGVDILALSSTSVTIKVDSCSGGGDTTGVAVLRLAPNSPNPFSPGSSASPTTRLSFNLPDAGRARLAVYDIRGREIRVLADGDLGPGPHEKEWDGKDKDGRRVSSGIYFARLTYGGQDRVQKIVLAR